VIRIPINLASEPFRKDRPILVASAVTAVLMLGLLGLLLSIILRERDASRESLDEIAKLERQLQKVSAETAKFEAQIRQPANESVLERGVFLNSLLQRKGISWTKLFSDLETVFPNNVRLVSVRPSVTDDNRIQLDMVVGSQQPQPVIDLLQKLESSSQFGSTQLLGWQPPSQNEPLYRYRVSVKYVQKL
jgi:Tfp pilus assembly protein PilN